MALSFTRLSCLWFGKKEKEQAPNGSSLSNSIYSLNDWGLGLRGCNTKIPSSSSNRKAKRKCKSTKRIDKEYDVVLVPSDGVCLSESESDDSDWSVGWMEPHAPDFQSDDEIDDSFAVLVPCYKQDDCKKLETKEEELNVQFFGGIKQFPNGYSSGGKKYMEQWLSSLQKV